jgi:hypothetical protein
MAAFLATLEADEAEIVTPDEASLSGLAYSAFGAAGLLSRYQSCVF